MGRKRVIDQEEILNGAEFVVVRDGAAHLTLDAVAEQAGISKASVIYSYKSKQVSAHYSSHTAGYCKLPTILNPIIDDVGHCYLCK
jgi:AcrR family transcriptional regulator